jgi:hypothetical protein
MSGTKLGLDEDTAKAFAVGLKLFGETILKNRENPLFTQMKLAMGEFMKSLKAKLRSDASE